tara:strand:- start:359 stop:520 length:162 start_codon:yes stop_codon:yes gene_type:complete
MQEEMEALVLQVQLPLLLVLEVVEQQPLEVMLQDLLQVVLVEQVHQTILQEQQ